ncbi:hypothetical protein GCM10009716_11300 [Streptomyces sodiiphilus]|uniref:Polyketide synthase n=1 Tax=Streptomyces sodiiphilus TaxID=226217 RepID=A0ABP5A468_9ACTN
MTENRHAGPEESGVARLAGRRMATSVDAGDPAVRDHLVHSVPVLPGVFLLDLVLRLARHAGVDPASVELRRIVFLAPVIGTDEGRRVEIVAGDPDAGSPVPVTVRSRPRDGAAEGTGWEVNCTAELHPASADPEQRIDLGPWTDPARGTVDVADLYAFVRNQLDIDHRGFMKASGTVHTRGGQALARMRLAEEAEPYLGHFHAHPAVLDFATLVPMLLFREAERAGARHAFIPISIDRFHATAGIGRENLVLVPGPVGGQLDSELFDADLWMCAPDGAVVARMTGFRAKRVRSAELITRRLPGRHEPPAVPDDVTGEATAGGAPAPAGEAPAPAGPPPSGGTTPPAGALGVVGDLVAAKLGGSAGAPDPDRGFYDHGLTSVDLLGIASELEQRIGSPLYPTLLFEYPTVRALAGYLRDRGHEDALTRPQDTAARDDAPAGEAEQAAAPPAPSRPAAPEAPRRARTPGGDEPEEPLAVVGLAGRYPGAASPDELWEVLREGRDRVTPIPADRWDNRPWFDARRGTPGRTYAEWGAFCDGVTEFDAGFFGITAQQARLMDPHERLFLQTAWEALEDGGHTPGSLAAQTEGEVGVFAGHMWNDYQLHGLDRVREGVPEVAGSWSSSLANRVSYTFDFQGPSLTVDTACSAALTALHLAVRSIRRGECRAALAGGVNLSLHPYKYLRLAGLGLLSPSGRCRPFAKDADGYVPGEGVGAVIIRPLADALASGDHIHGLIRGSALRHSGRTGGYSVPSPDSQARVVADALDDAGVPARTIGCVEAQATSTLLGDQIEIEALSSVYARHTDSRGFCAIGSVKGSIGHLEAAAGVAGLTKLLLALRHRTIPAGPDVGETNPALRLDRTPFYLPRTAEPWPRPVDPETGREVPRRAALSAFGAGGANVHLIVEEYTQPQRDTAPAGPCAVPVSARTEEQLRAQAERLARHLRDRPRLRLADVAHTLRDGRRPMEHRAAFVVSDLGGLVEELEALAEGRPVPAGSGRQPVRAAGEEPEALLAERWAAGEQTVWPRNPEAVRVPLPTYPFARDRYWLSEGTGRPPQPDTGRQDGPDAGAAVAATVLRVPRWQDAPLGVPADGHVPFAEGVVVAFDTDDRRVAELRGRCRRVVRVRPGMSWARTSADSFDISPGEEEHYRLLAAELRGEGAEPDAVLHLWALRPDPVAATAETGGVLSALLLCRSWALGRTGPLPVVYAYSAAGESPGHAAVGGLARSVRLEQPKLALKTVRFPAEGADAGVLLAEAAVTTAAGGPGTEIRYTPEGRQALVFAPLAQPAARPGDQAVPLARPGGTYLISGGAGALGLHTARLLARRASVSIVLVGRSAPGPHTDAAVAELEALGARAVYLSADITDPDAVSRAVAAATGRFGPLTGVVHCAGLVEDALLVNKTREAAERVLAPKTRGTAGLDAATRTENLDYFLLYSSVASVLGNPGATDYSAANRHLDSFAAWREERRAAGERTGRTVAVNWPLWREGGMTIDAAVEDRVLARTGSRPLETAEALDALDAAFACGEPQVVVLHGDREKLEGALDAGTFPVDPPEHAGAPRAAGGPDLLRRTEQYLSGLVGRTLDGPETAAGTVVDRDSGFLEMGMTSVDLVGLVRRVSADLGIELPPTALFRYPGIGGLAAHLLDAYGSAVTRRLPARPGTGPRPDGPRPALPGPAVTAVPQAPVREVPGDRPVAVIGMAGRFPGSRGTEGFWADLLAGRDLVSEVPADRWDHRLHHDPAGLRPDGTDCGHGAFLEDVDRFDAGFFQVPRAEAEGMDPQTRLLLEVLYETAENAGVAGRLRGSSTGNFVGRCFGDYDQEMLVSGRTPRAHDVTGTSVSMTANRFSYFFDLTGPSLVVDTACSSSMYALHLAVNSVRRGECEMAFAAGTNLILSPQHYLRSSALGALSPSGRCHTFDARADGYVPGEAVAAVLVKPLDRALADGDPVHGVIRATAVNHGGRAGSATAPNPARQAELLLRAWEEAGIDPGSLSYLEAHGTGTALGDPVEIEAVVTAMRRHTARTGFCAVGSAKAHLGHTEGAAGLVGVVKTLLSMRHEVIPPMPFYEAPNPFCAFDGGPLYVNTEAVPWPAGTARRAGVSSFGFGGAGAHAVLEEPPRRTLPEPVPGTLVFPFSARDEDALRELVGRHRDFLREHPGARPDRIAATLCAGREAMPCRAAVLADSRSGLLAGLDQCLDAPVIAGRLNPPDAAGAGEAAAAARRWVTGESDDLPAPPPDLPRLSLPAYPFSGERYWFEEAGSRAPVEANPAASAGVPPEADAQQAVREAQLYVSRSGFSGRHAAAGMNRLDELLRRWCRHLLGGGPEAGLPTAAALRRRLADEERYGKLADALAAMIAAAPADPGRRWGGPEEEGRLAAELASLTTDHPELSPWADLVKACVPRLPEFLAGEAEALEVFFSPDNPDLLLRIYHGNEVADHHNEIVARLVAAQVRAVRARRPDEPVRLLEIGGGTGGTTRRLLGALGEHRDAVHYLFTDVSPAFLPAARAAFSQTPVRFECRVLDLDDEPERQGFSPSSADVVIAANSVHATRSMADSLGRIRRLLAPAGVLVLEELVRNHDCMTAMIGPLPGYWSSVDPEVRLPHSPFLDVPRWRAALEEQGFARTWALGARDMDETEFDNAVLVSQVPSDLPVAAHAAPAAGTRPVPAEPVPAEPVPAEPAAGATAVAAEGAEPPAAGAEEVSERLRTVFARFFGRPAETLDADGSFSDYGMDSLSAIQLVRTLEPEFGKLPKVLLYEHDSIASLARYLVAHAPVPSRLPPPAAPPRPSTAGRKARAAHPAPDRFGDDPVAIVGMSGRFARSPDLTTWWRHLRDGVHLVEEIPAERFDWREVYGDPHRTPGKVNSRWGSFIQGVDRFDADFFGMTPLEAELMDPQQRIMLETAWRAVEDAGHRPAGLRGSRTGVFIGATSRDYDWQLHRAGRHREGHVVSGNGHCLIANRVSYQLDLRGPSEAVDTACSSSLTAVHRAVRAVRGGECDAALVGGVHLFLTADLFVALGQLGIMSPDGRCAAFDRRANGMVRGEASVAVLLKPLSRALAEGDTVYALVRGSGVSHGGGGRMDSLMMPNPSAQAELIASVHRDAGVDPRTIGYVEAHGTGTEVGDPIEVRGLRTAFGELSGGTGREPEEPWCGLGTVKSNVGHTEAAAGLTGLVKTVLAMRHGMIPPTLHYTEANPLLDLEGSPFYVVDRLTPWQAPGSGPRRAGVSAFGLGGTNAHVLLEEYPRPEGAGGDRPPGPQVLPLSARTPERLRAQAEELHDFLAGRHADGEEVPPLADIARTLWAGRDEMEHRLAVVAADTDGLVRSLRGYLDGAASADVVLGRAHRSPAAGDGRGTAARDPRTAAREWIAGGTPWLPPQGWGGARRVSLPAYPFAGERHWARPPAEPAGTPPPAVTPAEGDGDGGERLAGLLAAVGEGRMSVDEAEQLMEGVL